jgi:hypothetical protein
VKDPKFAAIAKSLESLLRRGRVAVEWEPGERDKGGKVLSAVEVREAEEELIMVDRGVQVGDEWWEEY